MFVSNEVQQQVTKGYVCGGAIHTAFATLTDSFSSSSNKHFPPPPKSLCYVIQIPTNFINSTFLFGRQPTNKAYKKILSRDWCTIADLNAAYISIGILDKIVGEMSIKVEF